ncbi:hypothetical protein SCFA_390002 [anaerobic digester metagenome]|uniref:Uncharacterized protein n=1 Tax=anaerobic digester metagenome TaxID=1263854 RepID=A0A485M4C5_9ZZZZ
MLQTTHYNKLYNEIYPPQEPDPELIKAQTGQVQGEDDPDRSSPQMTQENG